VEQRKVWCARLRQVDRNRLVYLDETGAKTNMLRLYARTKDGARAVDFTPQGHWNTTTLVAGLSLGGPLAPMVLDGPMDRACFEAYVTQVLIPALEPGAIVVMDNLSAHKSPSISAMFEAAEIELWYLPPYSPDFNPIEMMWAKVKGSLRSACARTQDSLLKAIAAALAEITEQHSAGFFNHCFVCMQS